MEILSTWLFRMQISGWNTALWSSLLGLFGHQAFPLPFSLLILDPCSSIFLPTAKVNYLLTLLLGSPSRVPPGGLRMLLSCKWSQEGQDGGWIEYRSLTCCWGSDCGVLMGQMALIAAVPPQSSGVCSGYI